MLKFRFGGGRKKDLGLVVEKVSKNKKNVCKKKCMKNKKIWNK